MNQIGPQNGAPVRILFADDSRLIRFAGHRILRDHFDVAMAEDGRRAWESVKKDDSIRAVVTDLMMPDMDGIELIHRIRNAADQRIRALPVMVVTSVEEQNGRRRALDAGANDLVPKPFTGSDLIDPLQEYLRRAPSGAASRPALPANVERTRIAFINRLEQVESFHHRHGLEFSLLHVRLDGYHLAVREHGLNHAEALMRHLERALAREVRTEDTVGRSDESTFSIVLMATPSIGARRLSERIRTMLARNPVRFPGHSVALPVRIAIQTPKPDSVHGASDLLEAGLARLVQPANVTRLADRLTYS
jgi:PleD family two-component response regulator